MTSEAFSKQVFRFSVGDISCTAFLDASDPVDEAAIAGMFQQHNEPIIDAFRALTVPQRFDISVLLLEAAGKRILIDAGMGDVDPTQLGKLLNGFKTEGITPDSIDTVILSHFHMDHIGGLLQDAGQATFPQARLVVPKAEFDYWMREDFLNTLDTMRASRLRATFIAYAARLVVMTDESDIEPGIHYIAAHGHTPGHSAISITSNGETLLHIVDTAHVPLQIGAPDVVCIYDVQPEAAIANRKTIIEHAIAENLLLQTYHFPFPGLGHIQRVNGLLTWVPYQP